MSGRKMKVLMVLHSHICGGAEIHALYMMDGLTELGHEVIFAGPRDSWIWEQVEKRKIPALSLPMHGMYDLPSIWKLCRFAKRAGLDLVHAHLVRGTFYGGVAAAYAGVPCVSTVHNVNVYKHLGRAQRLIAVSGAVRNSLLEHNHSPEKITIVHNGIPVDRKFGPEKRKEIRKQLGLNEKEIALCMVARFAPQKGHDLALKALNIINDPRLRLFLIGDPVGNWAEEIKRMVKDLGLGERAIFLGHSDKVAELLTGMDVFLAPSRYEGFGISIIEAMSAGLPVVASRVDGILEIIQHEGNGLLFEPGNVDALASSLKRIISDRELALRISSSAVRTIEERFSQQAMVKKALTVYEHVISAYKARN